MHELPAPEEFFGDVVRDNQVPDRNVRGVGERGGHCGNQGDMFTFAFDSLIADREFMTKFASFGDDTVARFTECRNNSLVSEVVGKMLHTFKRSRESSEQFSVLSGVGRKDVAKSLDSRDHGNRVYKEAKDLAKALNLYTKAIVFAPHVSFTDYPNKGVPDEEAKNDLKDLPQELALAYGNRSAIYFHLKQYEACLDDIESALEAGYNYFRPLEVLNRRKIDCLLNLDRLEDAEEMLDLFGNQVNNCPALMKRYEILKAKKVEELEAKLLKENEEAENGNMKMLNDPLDHPENNPIEYLVAKYGYDYVESPVTHRALGQKVKISVNEKRGRCLRAVVDIEPGEVLAAEDPYQSVLMPVYETYFCHHCQRRLIYNRACFPCRDCSILLYCSRDCRERSWTEYHRFECQFLQFLAIHPAAHLAFRLFMRIGLKKMFLTACFASGKYRQPELTQLPINPWPEELKNFLDDRSNAEFHLLFKLPTHLGRFEQVDLLKYTFYACFMTKVACGSGFLDCSLFEMFGVEKMEKNKRLQWKVYFGATLLRFMCLVDVNLVPVPYRYWGADAEIGKPKVDKAGQNGEEEEEAHKDPKKEKVVKKVMHYVKVGIALYPALALMNHSCDPSVESFFDITCMNIIRAIKPIKAGDEILCSYRANYIEHPSLEERRKLLQARFFFYCNCSRCALEARILNKLATSSLPTFYPLACDICSALIKTQVVAEENDPSVHNVEFVCTGCRTPEVFELKYMLTNYHQVSHVIKMCKERVAKVETEAGGHKLDRDAKERALRRILAELDICAAELKRLLVWRESVHLAEVYHEAALKCAAVDEWPDVEKYFSFYLIVAEHVYGKASKEYIIHTIVMADMKFALFKSRPLKGLAANCVEGAEKALKMIATLPIITQKAEEGYEEYFVTKRNELAERVTEIKKKVLTG